MLLSGMQRVAQHATADLASAPPDRLVRLRRHARRPGRGGACGRPLRAATLAEPEQRCPLSGRRWRCRAARLVPRTRPRRFRGVRLAPRPLFVRATAPGPPPSTARPFAATVLVLLALLRLCTRLEGALGRLFCRGLRGRAQRVRSASKKTLQPPQRRRPPRPRRPPPRRRSSAGPATEGLGVLQVYTGSVV